MEVSVQRIQEYFRALISALPFDPTQPITDENRNKQKLMFTPEAEAIIRSYRLLADEGQMLAEKQEKNLNEQVRLYLHAIAQATLFNNRADSNNSDYMSIQQVTHNLCSKLYDYVVIVGKQEEVLNRTLDNRLILAVANEVYAFTWQAFRRNLITFKEWERSAPNHLVSTVMGAPQNFFSKSHRRNPKEAQKTYQNNKESRTFINRFFERLGLHFNNIIVAGNYQKKSSIEDSSNIPLVTVKHPVTFTERPDIPSIFTEHGSFKFVIQHSKGDLTLELPVFYNATFQRTIVVIPDYFEFFFPNLRFTFGNSISSFHAGTGIFYDPINPETSGYGRRRLYYEFERVALSRCYVGECHIGSKIVNVDVDDYLKHIATSKRCEESITEATFHKIWKAIQQAIIIRFDPRYSVSTQMLQDPQKRGLHNNRYSADEHAAFTKNYFDNTECAIDRYSTEFISAFNHRTGVWSEDYLSEEQMLTLKNQVIDFRNDGVDTVDKHYHRLTLCSLGQVINAMETGCTESLWDRLALRFVGKYILPDENSSLTNTFATSFAGYSKTLSAYYQTETQPVYLGENGSKRTVTEYMRAKFEVHYHIEIMALIETGQLRRRPFAKPEVKRECLETDTDSADEPASQASSLTSVSSLSGYTSSHQAFFGGRTTQNNQDASDSTSEEDHSDDNTSDLEQPVITSERLEKAPSPVKQFLERRLNHATVYQPPTTAQQTLSQGNCMP